MGKVYLATKNNLLKLKNSIKEYKTGQMLLEEKELILKNKLEGYKDEAKAMQETLDKTLQQALDALKKAIVDIGYDNLIDISNAIKEDDTISIKNVTLMGVEIPSVISNMLELKLNYGLYNTTSDVDECIAKFIEVKKIIIKVAEINNIMIRLQNAIEKLARRSNALKEVIIPRDEKIAKNISLALEEEERDEFVRLKVVKRKQ